MSKQTLVAVFPSSFDILFCTNIFKKFFDLPAFPSVEPISRLQKDLKKLRASPASIGTSMKSIKLPRPGIRTPRPRVQLTEVYYDTSTFENAA